MGVVAEGKLLPSLRELFAMLTTFTLTVFAWIFFRAENVSHAFSYIEGIFSASLFNVPNFTGKIDAAITICLVLVFLLVDWFGRKEKNNINSLFNKLNIYFRILIYYIIMLSIFWFWIIGDKNNFIYFQF